MLFIFGGLNGSHYGNELGQTPISQATTCPYVSECFLPNVVYLQLSLAPQ